jgi:hypothetical protein
MPVRRMNLDPREVFDRGGGIALFWRPAMTAE